MYVKNEAMIKLEQEIEEACKQNDTKKTRELLDRVHVTGLSLDGLTSISTEIAEVLASRKNGFTEPGNTIIPADIKLSLSLDGLTTISPKVAQALANFKEGSCISLNGLTTISPKVAQALANFKGYRWAGGNTNLSLDGLTTISPEVAQALANFEGTILSLDGLTTISPEVAKALASLKGYNGTGSNAHIYLNGLTTVSPEVVQELALFKGEISFNKNNPDIQTVIEESGVDTFKLR